MFPVRPLVFALAIACASVHTTAAGAQTPAIDAARADIVGQQLVTGAIDISKAQAQPMPTLTMPVDAPGFMQEVQAKKPPAKTTPNIKDTGNPAIAPVKWVGLVMTRLSSTDIEYCTGQFIAPRVVLTAGHCVKDIDKNTWNDVNNMSFILQFQNGEGSHVYKVVCAAALDAYSHPANYASLTKDQQQTADLAAHQNDYAMILVDSDSLTGTIAWQGDWKGKWLGATRIGYPGDILNGEIIQQAHGIVFFADSIPIFTNDGTTQSFPNLVVHWQRNTKLTQGSSGGAWIVNFDPAEGQGSNIAISVSSFIMTDLAGAIFGPYLTATNVNALLQFTQSGCKS
jgi:V8-like Glu-specific endopeptidase